MRVLAIGDIGRVGDDDVERSGDAVQIPRLAKFDVAGNSVALGIRPGDREGGGRRVGGDEACALIFGGERDGQAAATGANVGDHAEHHRQCFFDDQLSFRTRDQHRGRHGEVAVPEFLHAGNVGDGFAPGAAVDQRLVGIGKFIGWRIGIAGVNRGAAPARRVHGEQQRIPCGLGRLDAGGDKAGLGVDQVLAQRHDCSVWSRSFSAV